ncbi:alkaline phosphatase D family protein [Pseudarthrobacter sulfonivorans]|uniref:alkaline phosphatase D family protein n=1 Tax=Pseudarthrobacter sulfonivorans TaxID=121292 RepID=UPI0012FE7CCB|nr:alkaline phosphatase D family protein [Pseudarthrobacter sulfonivorans]
MDSWDGCASFRRRIIQGFVDANVRDAVVLAGDVDRNWANDVRWTNASRLPGQLRIGLHLDHLHGNSIGSTVVWTPNLISLNEDRSYLGNQNTTERPPTASGMDSATTPVRAPCACQSTVSPFLRLGRNC